MNEAEEVIARGLDAARAAIVWQWCRAEAETLKRASADIKRTFALHLAMTAGGVKPETIAAAAGVRIAFARAALADPPPRSIAFKAAAARILQLVQG